MFVHGPYREAERAQVAEGADSSFELAYKITNDLQWYCDVEVLNEFLVEHPRYDLSTGGRNDWTVLVVAIHERALPVIQRVLDLNPRLLNATCFADRYTLPPLTLVAGSDDPEFAMAASREMIERGADVNLASREGETPLFNAARFADRPELIQFLLGHGGVIFQEAREQIRLDGVDEQPANIAAAFEGVALFRRGELGIGILETLPEELRHHIGDFIFPEQ